MKIGDKVWLMSFGNVIRRYVGGEIIRETKTMWIVNRIDRNGVQKFKKEGLHSVPYGEHYTLLAERPVDSTKMQPTYGQKLADQGSL